MQSYVELTQIKDDPRFGDIVIMYNPNNPNQRIMRKINKCQNLQEFEASKKQVQTRRQIDHPNILHLVDSEFDQQKMQTQVYFDYPEEMIDLNNLKPIDSIYLFRDILYAIQYLQNKRMIHGDIRPEYISYDNINKNYILLDRLLVISSPLQTQLNNIKNYKCLYMSPIVFNELMKKTKKIKQNSYKSELFSLGMLCLSIFEGTDKVQSFYSTKNKKFNRTQFEELLQNIQKRNYDETIKEFLNFLIQFVLVHKESKRSNPRNIVEQIKQYKNLKKVFFDEEPENNEINQSLETIKNINKKESMTSTNTDMSYYNPFDFVEVEQEMFQSDANPDLTDNEPLFDNSKKMRISEKIIIDLDAKKQNILVVTQEQYLIDSQDMQKKKNPQIILDQDKKPLFNKTIPDKLNQLKYFKLKLQVKSEHFPNRLTKEKPIRVSTKVIKGPQKNLDQQTKQIEIQQDKLQTKNLQQEYTLQKVVLKEIEQQKIERRLSEVFSRDDSESLSSKPLDSKNSELRQEESLGITIKEEKEEINNQTQTLAFKLGSLKELDLYIKDENILTNKNVEVEKSPSGTKKNLKQFLRTTSFKPKETMQILDDLNETNDSKIDKTIQEKKIIQSFNFINPKNQQKNKQQKREKNNVIVGNYQLMNLNNKKEIGKNLKNKINDFKKGVTSDRFYFNVNKKLSQSPVDRQRDNIIQFSNAKRAKSHNMRGIQGTSNLSSRLDQLEFQNQKVLNMQIDKTDQNYLSEVIIENNHLKETQPLKQDKAASEFPGDTILQNIEIRLKYKELEEYSKLSIQNYQKNDPKVSTNSTNTYDNNYFQQEYKKKNIKYSYKLDNRYSRTRDNDYYDSQSNQSTSQTQIDFPKSQYQTIDTKSQIEQKYYQTEPRKNSLYIQNLVQQKKNQVRITQDKTDHSNFSNKIEDLRNQIIQREQQAQFNKNSQNLSNLSQQQNIYQTYTPKYNNHTQPNGNRRIINNKQYNNSIEYTKIRDTSQLKQPKIISSKYLDFQGNDNNYMRNTVNLSSGFSNQNKQSQMFELIIMKILFFIIFVSIKCDGFEDLLRQALQQTLDEPSDKVNIHRNNQNKDQISEQEFLTKLFDEAQGPKTHEILLSEKDEPYNEQDVIRQDKDQIAQLVEDIENHKNKQHPLHDDKFEDIAQQFAEALHKQTERMKNAQLLDEHDEENYHRREVHPEVIIISEKPDNIDHFDPIWEKNNNYNNIKRVQKQSKNEIEVIEIPDGYIREPDHYQGEYQRQHDFPQVSSGQVYPKLGIKGNKQFKSELKEIFQELGQFLNQEQPQAQSNEEQKTDLQHIQASEDDTHFKFAKVTAKEHKIPKDKLDIEKLLEVIETLQQKKVRI